VFEEEKKEEEEEEGQGSSEEADHQGEAVEEKEHVKEALWYTRWVGSE
jgi:hypothetical protein